MGRIAFIGEDGNLWLLELPTGKVQQLTEGERIQSPAWSPDGRQLAYVRETTPDHQREMVLFDLNSRVQRVVPVLRDPMLAAVGWSPDGQYLTGDIGCCAAGRQLVLLDASGTQVRRTLSYAYRYAWSPDGRYLALGQAVPLTPTIPIEASDSSSVVVLDMMLGSERTIRQGTREALYFPLCWLSDTTLVYRQRPLTETNPSGPDKRWKVAIDSPLTPMEVTAEVPAQCDNSSLLAMLPQELRGGAGPGSWSPDREWVIVSVTNDAHHSIYLVHDRSHAVRQVADGTEPVWQPATPPNSQPAIWASAR